MPLSLKVSAAVSDSNRRRGEQDPVRRAARKLFMQQRYNAKLRSIEWRLTFDEWWSIWHASGRFEQRGRRRGQYVMCRRGDVGPYAADNVFIDAHVANTIAGTKGRKRTREQNAARGAMMRGNTNGIGLRWVSKDGESRHVKSEEVASLIADGWRIGRDTVKGNRFAVGESKS